MALGIMLAVALLALVISIPIVTINSTDVSITTYTPARVSSSLFISPPTGYLQNLSSPSVQLERQYGEQLVVVKQFYPSVHPENFSYTVYIEVGQAHSFLVKHWQYLGGYNRTTVTSTLNGTSSIIYSTLLNANGSSMVAVSYEIPVAVMWNGQFQSVNVGVSVLAHPEFPVDRAKYEAINQRMILDFAVPQVKLLQASAWTSDASLASTTLGSISQYAGLGAGVTLVMGVLGVVLRTDRGEQKLLDSIEELGPEDQTVLAKAVNLGANRKPVTGSVLFDAAGPSLGHPTKADFYNRLVRLEALGYLRMEPCLVGDSERFMWRLKGL